ncbi:MAG: hypothetical protein CME06_09285 [Gemmatimonadetes bacterium]|nr:hypothetical protein [Gemmatimonadota bacterium]
MSRSRVAAAFGVGALLGAFGVGSVLLSSCESDTPRADADLPSSELNLLMIAINNVAWGHMSLAGYGRDTTPNLDRWARDAVVFENFYSHCSWTLPAGTSLFTSLYPYTHGVLDRYHGNLLDDDVMPLAEVLSRNGYETAAFTGGLDYKPIFGHMRGFDEIADNDNFTSFETTFAQAREWIESRDDGGGFFCFVHGYDAHSPFNPPDRFKGVFSNLDGKNITVTTQYSLRGYQAEEGRYVAHYIWNEDPFLKESAEKRSNKRFSMERRVELTQDDIEYLTALYDEEVLHIDSLLDRFLRSIDGEVLRNTIVVILSEHGEMFAKHGRFGRAGTVRGNLYDDVVHVPFLLRAPGLEGKRVDALAQMIDVMPTVLEIMGISPPVGAQGRSLLPAVGGVVEVNDFGFAGGRFNHARKKQHPFFWAETINESIRSRRWKLIRELIHPAGKGWDRIEAAETFELYDVMDDGDEGLNVADENPRVLAELSDRLATWAAASKKSGAAEPATVEVPRAMEQEAREKGYW